METYNFFAISVYTMNLFSLMLGIAIGLSTGAFSRYRTWWIVCVYLCGVAGYYAIKAGVLLPYFKG